MELLNNPDAQRAFEEAERWADERLAQDRTRQDPTPCQASPSGGRGRGCRRQEVSSPGGQFSTAIRQPGRNSGGLRPMKGDVRGANRRRRKGLTPSVDRGARSMTEWSSRP
jgi:hypothetical protein